MKNSIAQTQAWIIHNQNLAMLSDALLFIGKKQNITKSFCFLLVWLCSVFFSTHGLAQDKLVLDANDERGKFWQLWLRLPELDDHVLVTSRIFWENKEVPRTECQFQTLNQTLIAEYGPIPQKIPCGKYVWELTGVEDPHSILPFRKEFYVGTPGQRQIEARETAQFYKQWIGQVNLLCQEIKQSKPNPQMPIQEMLRPLQDWYVRSKTFSQKLELYQKEYWFITDAESYRNMKNLLHCTDMIVLYGTYQIAQNTHISWEPELPQKLGKPTQEQITQKIQFYLSQINRLSEKILIKQSLPENLTEQNLQEDLVWFNRLFQELQELYEEYQTNSSISAEKWLEKAKNLENEVIAFGYRIEDYKSSDLPKIYPKLNLYENLQSLVKQWQNLFSLYSNQIQGKRPSQNQAKIIAELQKIFIELNNIEKIKADAENKARQEALKKAEEDINHLRIQYDELKRNLTLTDQQKFTNWSNEWVSKIQKIQSTPMWEKRLNELGLEYHFARLEMLNRIKIENDWRKANTPAMKQVQYAKVKRIDYILYLHFVNLEKILQEATTGKNE